VKTIVIGVSDCQVSGQPDSVLVTYALGSCIAISACDPQSKVGGLLHFMLPESSLDAAKARQNPSMFGDSGIQLLIQMLKQKGLNPRRCTWTVTGGAQVLDGQGTFQIGKRNYLAAKKLLWKEGLLISGEAVGGEVSRTVRLELDSGKFWIREGGGREMVLTKNSHGASLWRSAS
jgi:chemotaxis protein CheD